MKILLFDIDGTLLFPGKTPRRCLNRALSEFLGEEIYMPIEKLAGYTDPVIIRNALKEKRFQDGSLDQSVNKVLSRYLELLSVEYPESKDQYLYPHVLETLREFDDNPEFRLGLLTGNHSRGAEIKLAPFGIIGFFETGAFGEDAGDRAGLPPVALHRFSSLLGKKILPKNAIIIGDTARDVQAARLNNLKSIAVVHNEKWRKSISEQKPDLTIDGFHELDKLRKWMQKI